MEELRRFNLALWEMSRIYAYNKCRVIVLPESESIAGHEQFERAPHPLKQRECLRSPTWGWVNDVPYGQRGWPCAEFATALRSGVIINKEDPAVKSVLAMREWPKAVQDYTEMMLDPKIEFTCRGDRDHVVYIFFKMCSDLRQV